MLLVSLLIYIILGLYIYIYIYIYIYLSPSIFSFYQLSYAKNFGHVTGVMGEMDLMKGTFVVFTILICWHLS